MWNTPLSDRIVIHVAGEDSATFLQGLISNDIQKATPARSLYSALLTPQGKFLFDFFVLHAPDGFLLDAHQSYTDALIEKLTRFRLRSKVTLSKTAHQVAVAWGDMGALTAGETQHESGFIRVCDPRHAAMGWRFVYEKDFVPPVPTATREQYEAHRLALGIPDGAQDMVQEKDILLELGFEELHGVDFTKGCYMGQELTARTKYRALIKKHLYQVNAAEGIALPASLTAITANGAAVGEMRSSLHHTGLALLRDEAVESGAAMSAEGIALSVRRPAWMNASK